MIENKTMQHAKGIQPLEPNNEPIVYQEPGYRLSMKPMPFPPEPEHKKPSSLYDKITPFDQEATRAAYQRYKDVWATLSSSKREKIVYEIAHSLVPRADYTAELDITYTLAKQHELTKRVRHELTMISSLIQDHLQLEELVQMVFSRKVSSAKDLQLPVHLYLNLVAPDENTSVRQLLGEKIIYKILELKKDLSNITSSHIQYIRPPFMHGNPDYLHIDGSIISPHHTHPSSKDRTHPNVQNGRLVTNFARHLIYSTGRVDTALKAEQVINAIFRQAFESGQIEKKDLLPNQDGSFSYPLMIEDLLNASILSDQERQYILSEDRVLTDIQKTPFTFTLPGQDSITLYINPLHFSSHANFNSYLAKLGPFSCTGSLLSQSINAKALNDLTKIYNHKKAYLSSHEINAVDRAIAQLSQTTDLKKQWILRAWICEILRIPYHIHCKSSKDRTAVVAAIKQGLFLWMQLEKWKNPETYLEIDPSELFESDIFRNYTESSLFEALPFTDQGMGFSAELGTKKYADSRGFDYRSFIFENPIPSFVLSSKYLKTHSLITKSLLVLSAAIFSLITTIAFTALSPIITLIVYIKMREKTVEVMQYLFLLLATFPVQSVLRKTWLDKQSSTLQERQFFKTSHLPSPSSTLQLLEQQLALLSAQEHRLFITWLSGKWIENEEETALFNNKKIQAILQHIISNWHILHELKRLPKKIMPIMVACLSSPRLIFQLLRKMNEKTLFPLIQNTVIPWPANSYIDESNSQADSQAEWTPEFIIDFPRMHVIVKTASETKLFGHHNQSIEAFAKSLLSISALKGEKRIPPEIQMTLSQCTHIHTFFHAISLHLQYSVTPENAGTRIYQIEEGSEDFFWLTLQEKLPFVSDSDPSSPSVRFSYQYTFKIYKAQGAAWKSQFVSFSPIYYEIDSLSPLMFEIITPSISLKEAVHRIEMDTLKNLPYGH